MITLAGIKSKIFEAIIEISNSKTLIGVAFRFRHDGKKYKIFVELEDAK